MPKITFNYNREGMKVEVGRTRRIINELILTWMETGAWTVKVTIPIYMIWVLTQTNVPKWIIWFMVILFIGYIFNCFRLHKPIKRSKK